MSGYRSVNYYDLCRLCTTSSGTKIHIFSAEGKKKNLHQKICECLPITVDEKDKLPKVLCGQCLQQIESIMEFRSNCLNSQAMLEGCLDSTLQNGGKVYIKDVNTKVITQTISQVKQSQPQQHATLANISTQNSDFLSSIIQAVGIQSSDDVTVENRVSTTPQYTVTLDGKSINTGQIQYKVEEAPSITNTHCGDKQTKHNSLTEFLKMKPNIKVTPIPKKKPEPISQTLQVQTPITITSPEGPRVKKPKYNIVLTSPTQPKQQATIIQNASVVPAAHHQLQHTQPTTGKTVSLQDVKLLSSANKCFLPITLKDCNTDQQIVAQIDTKNFVLPTTYQLQMKIQPQLATVDGQPIVQLTPTAIPATLSLAPTQGIASQSFQHDPTTNHLLTAGIDASTSTNEPEIIFTTTNQLHNSAQGITIQPLHTNQQLPKLQITTIPTSAVQTSVSQIQTQKPQNTITVQRITPQNVKMKTETTQVGKLPTLPTKQQHLTKTITSGIRSNTGATVSTTSVVSGTIGTSTAGSKQLSTTTTATTNIVTSNKSNGDGNQYPVSMLECSVCTRAFKKKEHLAQHMKLHQGLRPFKCTEPNCNKAFSRKEHLMRHIVSHTGKKMFSCDLCQKLFSRKDNLNKHKRTHSDQGSNNAQFVCDVCNKSFVVKMYYIQHKLMHEKNANSTGNAKAKSNKHENNTENVNSTNNQIQTIGQNQQLQTQQHQQQHINLPQSQQIMQLQISSPVVTTSGGANTITITSAPDQQQHTTTATVLKTLGSHDTTVLNLPSSLANLVSLNSAQFVTTADIMGHLKLENK